jgi:heme exporter protein B
MNNRPAFSSIQSFFQTIKMIIWKDLKAEFRSRELLTAMLVFALLVILMFNFALELDIRLRSTITAGVLWTTFVFAGALGLNRSLAIEKDRGCLDGLLLAPVERSAIYFGKVFTNLIMMLLMAVIVIPVYTLLYNVNLFRPIFFLVVLLGCLGYAVVGTLLSSMTVQTRSRDTLLPILLFPVAIPILVASVKASSGVFDDQTLTQVMPWINLLIGYDVIFIALAFMVFDEVVQE